MKNMKKILAVFLVITIVMSCIVLDPATISAENQQWGLYATYYQGESFVSDSGIYMSVFEQAGAPDVYGSSTEPNGDATTVKWFDETINELLNVSQSYGATKENLSTFMGDYSLGLESYMVHFTGTITAEQTGTYTFVGLQVDNGCVIKVNGNVVYEYWGRGCWFDGDGHRLAGDASFELNANEAAEIEVYFLELNGGEMLDFQINNGESDKSFEEAGISFDLNATTYRAIGFVDTTDIISGIIGKGGGNQSATFEGNDNYDESIARIKEIMSPVNAEPITVDTFIINNSNDFRSNAAMAGCDGNNGILVEYTGYITADEDATYSFGLTKADNGCVVEINGQRVIEYWGDKDTFWDNGEPADGIYMTNSTVEMQAGESLPIHVVFLELNGEEGFTMTVKKNGGNAVAFDASGLTLSPGTWENMNTEPVEYDGHFYQRFDKGMTWQEAKAYCEDLGGYLVTITSAEEQAFVETLVAQGSKYQYWIGLTTAEEPQWVTGEVFSYSNWDYHDPDNHTREDGESEDYVHINNKLNPANTYSERFKWNDMYYDNTYPGEENHFSTNKVGFICEWGSSEDDTEFNGNTYQLFDESLTWQEAKAYCEDIGGHLVTITSEEEQAFVEKLLSQGAKSQYWIGLTTAEEPQWITGEEFSYSNWDPGEPDNHVREDGESEDYVHIHNVPNPQLSDSEKYKWNDMYYDNTFPGEEDHFSLENVGFICEWEGKLQSSEYASLMGEGWSIIQMEGLSQYLDTVQSTAKIIVDAYKSDQNFMRAAAVWEATELVFEPGTATKDALNMTDYYTAILISLIDKEITNQNYVKSLEEECNFEYIKLYNQMCNIIKACDEVDQEALLAGKTCTIEEITIINDRISALDYSTNKITKMSNFLSSGKTINDCINSYINYANLCNVSNYITNVLRKMQSNSSDIYLSAAIEKILFATETAFSAAAAGFQEGVENAGIEYASKIVNDAWQDVLKSNSLTQGALLGYKVGKSLSNMLFSTDKIISNYYEFVALYEIEESIKKTLKDFETAFYYKTDADSSLNYINTVALLFNTYYLSCDYATELAEYTSLPWFFDIFGSEDQYEETKAIAESTKVTLETYEMSIFKGWIYALKEKYPDIYTEILPSLGNIYSSDLSDASVKLEYMCAITTGEALEPNVTVHIGNDYLSPEEYTVKYYNNINPGSAKVVISAAEGSIYTGQITACFEIKDLDYIKRFSIRQTLPIRSLYALLSTEEVDDNSYIELPDFYIYEGESVVAAVECGEIICNKLPLYVSEDGIDVLLHDKDYSIKIGSSSNQIVSAELQKLDKDFTAIEIVNYNNLYTGDEISCEIKSGDEDELSIGGVVLSPDFSSHAIDDGVEYNILSEQCIVKNSAYANQRVYVNAIIPEGHVFVGWSISPQVSLSSEDADACFVMPEEDVCISASLSVNEAYFELKNTISEAKNIEQALFTKESYSNLQSAIDDAQAVLTNDISKSLSQEKVNNIQLAVDSLEEIDELKFSGASLTLQDNLAINYKVSKSLFEESGYTNPYVKFVLNDVETVVTEYTVVGDNYVFDFTDIAPHMINDTVYATLYATYNGVEYASATREYSVATYCYNMLGKYTTEEYAELQTLLVDLLNYGSRTQEYLGYQTDNLANAQLTEEQVAWGTSTERTFETLQDTKYEAIENPSVLWKGAGLTLQDSITMRFKIAAESVEGLSVKVICAGGEWTVPSAEFELIEEGSYYVYFDALSAAQMSEPVYLTVYKGDTAVSHTVRYSVESYAYVKQNDADTNLVALIRAMMQYGDSAYAYVN